MKKVLVVCLALAGGTFFSGDLHAQKIGFFDEQQVLALMPGVQKVDTLLNQYVNDSLKTEYDIALDDYRRLDSTLKKDSASMNPSKKAYIQGELNRNFVKIQNWQQYQQQMYQAKEQVLLKPFLEKIYNALQELIAAEHYTWVLKADAIHPYSAPPIQDNLTLKVAQRMKLKLPPEAEEALRAAQNGGASKPPVRPAGKN